MKKKSIILVLVLVISLGLQGCNGQESKASSCEELNKIYVDYALKRKKDSALLFLNKAIECDPQNKLYRSSKVNFLVDDHNWLEASSEIKKMDYDDDVTLKMMIAVLDLKMEKVYADENLKKLYVELENGLGSNYENVNYFSFYIALNNYFENKESALLELSKFENKRSDTQWKSTVEFLEDNISNLGKKEVLYKFFNIRK